MKSHNVRLTTPHTVPRSWICLCDSCY